MYKLKAIIRQALKRTGFEIRRIQPDNEKFRCRSTMRGCLQKSVENGLSPSTVIDIGAAYGTPPLYEAFPHAKHLLIEPLAEYTPALQKIATTFADVTYIIAAAGESKGKTTLNVHPDLVGSSIYKEGESSNVNGVERTVPMMRLDDYCKEQQAQGSYLIKIDTQGAEIDVLKGANQILEDTTFIILEASLFEFFKGGPQIYDCITYMKEKGFVVYDIFDPQYRLLDGAMSQVDIAFVQENGSFREYHFYATKEQREIQNKQFLEQQHAKPRQV